MFTPDGREMWFGRLEPAAIWYSCYESGTWTEPAVAPFCDDYGELYPALSPDGNRVYYTSTRPPTSEGKPRGRGNGHIWVVEREGDSWSKPRYLDGKVNFSNKHSCGSVAEDGTMYFTARVEKRSMDIFRCQLTGDGYGDVQILLTINSNSPDHSPFVAPDQSYIIYSSFQGGLGRSDLFISFRLSDSTWSGPRNLGDKINSRWKDEYPFVSPDGKYLFFNSNRPSQRNDKPIPDGPGNIYWVDAGIIDELRSLIQK
jgi:Tol biopolymer transport system component